MPSYARETLSLHGVAPDLIPQDAPAEVWNTAQNVWFKNGEAVRAIGDRPTLPTARTPLVLIFTRSVGTGYWVYATEAGIYAHDGAVEYDITPAGGWAVGAGAVCTACVLSGIVYLNASSRDPVLWAGNPVVPAQPLPDWPAGGRCLSLRAHKNFLFGVGFVSEGDQRVRWSDAAAPGEAPQAWTPAADNLAGYIDLAPLWSPCREAETLRDDLLVYKEESIWGLRFVGGNAVFQARKLFSEHGIAQTGALCSGPNDEHLFVGDDGDVYLTDGTAVRSVLDGRAQRAFYADFTSAARDAVFSCAALSREKLGLVVYPSASSTAGSLCLVYDFVGGDIGFREMPQVLCAAEGQALLDVGELNTWDGDPEAWQSDRTLWNEVAPASSVDDVVIGGAFGFRLISDPAAGDFVTGPVEALLGKSGIAFGDPQRRKLATRLWPKVTGAPGDVLRFRVGGQEVTGGPVSWAPEVAFTLGAPGPLDCFVEGRYLSLQVASSGGSPWRLGSLDVEFRGVGKW